MSMKSSHTDARSDPSVAAAGTASVIESPSDDLRSTSSGYRRWRKQKGDSVPAVALQHSVRHTPDTSPSRASRSRVLLEVLAYQLGHLEHAHGTLAAEHFLQRGIRVDVPLVLGIL